MQKISSYLYPNRVELLVDVAGFTTEYTNVYQKTVKIYNGIDNTIQFDIKNADQKRIDLSTLTNIALNVMDSQGNELYNSPYTVSPLDQTTFKGIATVTIPQDDLLDLQDQYLRFSVTAIQNGNDVILYGDTRFGATGSIQLIGDAMPTFRNDRVFKEFTAEIDLDGFPISKSSAIPAFFYEAEKTTELTFNIDYTEFKGIIWIEGTSQSTITTEAFKPEVRLHEFPELTSATTGTFSITMAIDDYKYFRVRYQNSKKEDITSDNAQGLTGKVDRVTVS
jgi:uncharacterized membrane protein